MRIVHLFRSPIIQSSGNFTEAVSKRIQELVDREKCKMLTSGHGMAIVFIQITATMFTCIRPVRDQASKIPSMDEHEAPHLSEELLVDADC